MVVHNCGENEKLEARKSGWKRLTLSPSFLSCLLGFDIPELSAGAESFLSVLIRELLAFT